MVTMFAAPAVPPVRRNARWAPGPAHTPLHVRHQTAADRSAWSVARDIGWDRICPDRHPTPASTLDALRDACLAEAVRLVAVGRLAGAVAEDMDGSVAASIVAGEGAKHLHALHLYLNAAGHRPDLGDRELERSRREALAGDTPFDPVESVVDLLLSEHLASSHYRTLAGRTGDPVLRDLLRLIAADKVRHARMAADVLEEWVTRDASLASRVSEAAAVLHRSGSQCGNAAMGRQSTTESAWGAGQDASVRTLTNRLARISRDAASRTDTRGRIARGATPALAYGSPEARAPETPLGP